MARDFKRVSPQEGEWEGADMTNHVDLSSSSRVRSRTSSALEEAMHSSARKRVKQGLNDRGRDHSSTISLEDATQVGGQVEEGELQVDQAQVDGEVDMLAEEDREEEEDELIDETGDDVANLQQRGHVGVPSMGVIEQVDLTNFMCHKRLTIDLGPKVNFVIGHNGSGKSAILTAMTIALGAKAINTSRGSSIKAFVKEGEEGAVIKLTMTNTGIDAFRHDVYGDKIIIERTIRANGSGAWKIKSRAGNVVSTTREEIDAICAHANIQADNPINFLTQDASRQFLTSSSPADKYDLFMRGTQLSQLELEYDQIQRCITQIEEMLTQKKDGLKHLEQKANDARSRVDIIKRARVQAEELEILRKQAVWSQVKEKETALAKAVFKQEREETRCKKIKTELDTGQIAVQEHEDVIKEAEARMNAYRMDLEPLLREEDLLKARHKAQQKVVVELTRDVATIDDQYKNVKNLVEDIKERIQEAEKAAAGGQRARRLQLSNKRDQLKLECEKMQNEEREIRDSMASLELELSRLTKDLAGSRSEHSEARENVSAIEMHMRRLRDAKRNHMAAYGPNMPKLLKYVQDERHFRGPVVGPIGAVVKIKDPQWAPLLESVIGNTLNAFCVTNVHDQKKLLELKHKASCNEVPILTGSDDLFDYSSGEPDENILTVLRVLEIQDEFVKRQLITAVSIERSALVQQRVDGDMLMRSRPRNVKLAFSKDGKRLAYSEFGSSTQTLQVYRGPPRLSSNVDDQLREAEARHAREERAVLEKEEAMEAIRSEQISKDQEKRRLIGAQDAIQKQLRQKFSEREKIEEELREDEPANVTALQESLKEFEVESEKLIASFQEKQTHLQRAKDELQPINDRRQAIAQECQSREAEEDELQAKLTEAAQNRLTAVNNRQHYEGKLHDAKQKLKELANAVEYANGKYEEFKRDALNVCEHVETDEPPEVYKTKAREMTAKIAQARRQEGVDLEAVVTQARRPFEQYNTARGDIKTFEYVRNRLFKSLRLRIEKWAYFRSEIAKKAKVNFAHYLSARDYEGRLNFDHNNRRLALVVRTETALKKDGDKKPQSLSGGEKSYATICLLLALWEAAGCSIRCLDEFDVFMDAVNRRVSMKLIMDVAKRETGTQYVLITPQNISNIHHGPHIRISRLRDPERNQTTLT